MKNYFKLKQFSLLCTIIQCDLKMTASYTANSFCAMFQLVFGMLYVILAILIWQKTNNTAHIGMWIFAFILFILPCAISIYGVYSISQFASKHAGLLLLFSVLYLVFFIGFIMINISYQILFVCISFILWAGSTLFFVSKVISENWKLVQSITKDYY